MCPKRALIGLGACLALTGALGYSRIGHREAGYEISPYHAINRLSKTGDLNAAAQDLAAAGNEAVSRLYRVIEILNAQGTRPVEFIMEFYPFPEATGRNNEEIPTPFEVFIPATKYREQRERQTDETTE